MSKKVLQLGFCFLAIAALSVVPALATPAPSFGYTQSGVGSTMDQACANAAQKIKDNCDFHGPISTDPGRCLPLWGLDGQVIGQVCTCEATTLACAHFIGLP
jgi:hypothetical protein